MSGMNNIGNDHSDGARTHSPLPGSFWFIVLRVTDDCLFQL
jgi:hypothetical protein